MKKFLFFSLILCAAILTSQAQFCNTGLGACYQVNACYQDSEIHTKDYVFSTVKNVYSSATSSVDLYMTVYSSCTLPDNISTQMNDVECGTCKRPFIMLIHGGGFRAGCRSLVADECMEFAKRGYVVAAIDYRLGWVPGDAKSYCKNFCYDGVCNIVLTSPCNPSLKDSLNFAVYRSIQDASAAMRYVVHYAGSLNIDTSFLYVGGYSAGSITAVNLTYMMQAELNNAFPKAYGVLGAFNHYGNNYKDSYKIAGLFNNWGCIYDLNYINGPNDKIPMIAFHGIDDSIVPFAKGYPSNCANGSYGVSYGSRLIFSQLINTYPDLPVELYACYGGHGIFSTNPETDPKTLYRIEKAICFFNRVRNGDKSRRYVYTNQNEDDITINELDSLSPVNCNFGNNINNLTASTNIKVVEPGSNKVLTCSVYPNPAGNAATLIIKGKFKKISIQLADVDGKVLWKKENISETRVNIPVSNLNNGLYFVAFKSEAHSGVVKFSKVN